MLLLMYACAGEPVTEATAEPVESERPGHWERLGKLAFGHTRQTATPLDDGRVLVFGGFSDRLEAWDPAKGRSISLASAPSGRMHHAALAVNEGLLVVGGRVGDSEAPTSDVLLYELESDAWSALSPLPDAREGHAIVDLDGPTVVGGFGADGQALSTTWRLKDDEWTRGPEMPDPRGNAVWVQDGDSWLVIGGQAARRGSSSAALSRFDRSGWTALEPMQSPRHDHTAVRLDDGRVLVAGGSSGSEVLATVELYDPKGDTWSAGPSLNTARADHGSGLLADGRVVVFGGRPVPDSPDVLAIRELELYTPGDAAWTTGVRTGQARYGASVIALDGRVLVLGGHTRSKLINDVSVYSGDDKPKRTRELDDADEREMAAPEPMMEVEPQDGEPLPLAEWHDSDLIELRVPPNTASLTRQGSRYSASLGPHRFTVQRTADPEPSLPGIGLGDGVEVWLRDKGPDRLELMRVQKTIRTTVTCQGPEPSLEPGAWCLKWVAALEVREKTH